MPKQRINRSRREFLLNTMQTMAAAGFALPVLAPGKSTAAQAGGELSQAQKPVHVEYRTLGNTGMKVTAVSYGAMRTRDEAVIQRALDLGINYIDTARGYLGGLSESIIGNIMKTRRKEAFLATKFKPGTVSEILELVETSLKALQTDHIDVIQAHGLSTLEQIKNPNILEALTKLKKDGKVRFVGFSTHKNMTELIREATKMKFYDTVLTTYNFQVPADLTEAIEEAGKAGIGIIAMKTQVGGYTDPAMGGLSPHQAALKWVLQNKGIATAIPSMVTYDQLNENVQVMGAKLGRRDHDILDRYARTTGSRFCRMCGACTGRCPFGVEIADVHRALMYREGYGDSILAHETYHGIPESIRPAACTSCAACRVFCRFGIDIKKRMTEALAIWA